MWIGIYVKDNLLCTVLNVAFYILERVDMWSLPSFFMNYFLELW